jgi:hypothetical protein
MLGVLSHCEASQIEQLKREIADAHAAIRKKREVREAAGRKLLAVETDVGEMTESAMLLAAHYERIVGPRVQAAEPALQEERESEERLMSPRDILVKAALAAIVEREAESRLSDHIEDAEVAKANAVAVALSSTDLKTTETAAFFGAIEGAGFYRSADGMGEAEAMSKQMCMNAYEA